MDGGRAARAGASSSDDERAGQPGGREDAPLSRHPRSRSCSAASRRSPRPRACSSPSRATAACRRLGGARQGQPDLAHPGHGDLDGGDHWRSCSSVLRAVRGDRRHQPLHHRRHLPRWSSCFCPSPSRSRSGMMTLGTPKWPKVGPWDLGAGAVHAGLRAVGHRHGADLLHRASSRRTTRCCRITVGFILLSLIVCGSRVENRRFQGPPIGDQIAKRQAVIRAAERAVGETA